MLTSRGEVRARRLTLAVFGTRGTVFPLLALGKALVERGHHVTFATPDRFRGEVEACGMVHRTLRPDPLQTQEAAAAAGLVESTEAGVRGTMLPRVEDTYRDLLAASEGSELLVAPMFLFPAPMVAERLGLPWAEVHLAPGTLNSAYDPPFLPPVPWLYPLQRRSRTVSRIFTRIAGQAIASWYAPLRKLRAQEGFSPLQGSPLLGGMRSSQLTLALFSACFGAPQPDWAQPNLVAGFPFLEEPAQAVPPDVDAFFKAGEPPLVATLGSALSMHRPAFFESMLEAAAALQRRLLVIAGASAAALLRKPRSASILIVGYTPYAQAFAQASTVIVSGAVGPISQGLRAGKPMLIVPVETVADQPDNARRVERMGAGRWENVATFSVDAATAHLRALQSGSYAEAAQRYGRQIQAEDAGAKVGGALEALLDGRGMEAA